MTATVIPATMRDGKVCLTQNSQNAWLSPIFDSFRTGQRFVYPGMIFCNVLRFFAVEAISNDELVSQSGSFLPATEYFFQ